MKKLILSSPWPAPRRIMQPGEYLIPADISMLHAKCAVADKAGEIVEAKPFRQQKAPAPENKSINGSPEDKELAGSDRGGDGTEPNGRGRKPASRKKSDSGK